MIILYSVEQIKAFTKQKFNGNSIILIKAVRIYILYQNFVTIVKYINLSL